MIFFRKIEFHSRSEKRVLLFGIILSLVLFSFDQLTKQLIVSLFSLGEIVPVIPRVFNLTYVVNRGAAWGIFSGKGWLLLLISLCAFLGIVLYLRKLTEGWTERYYAMFLILSGIVGNSVDRIFRGEVVDFLQFYWGSLRYQWPSFNVADSCITAGVILFVISTFCRPEAKKSEHHDSESSETTAS